MKTKFELKDDIGFASREEIRKLQDRLLAEQIRYCRAHSPFYRERLAALPDRDFDFDSLQELPTTSKRDLAEHNDAFFAVSGTGISDICFTSGTTGRPCRIVYTAGDLDRLAYNDACGYRAAGMCPGEKVLLTCTIDRCFIAGLAYYQGVVKLGGAAIRNGLNDTMADLHDGLTYSPAEGQQKLLDLAEAEYTGDTLVPVWFMSMKSKNRVLYAVQNGVTGDMWADKPLDIPRFAGLTAVLAVILYYVFNMFLTLRPEMAMLVAMLLAVGAQEAVNSTIASTPVSIANRGMSRGLSAHISPVTPF